MNWNSILIIFRKELRDQLRDRRTLLSTIVLPTLIMPLIIFGFDFVMSKVMKKAADEGTTVMVVRSAEAPELMQALQADPKFRVLPETADFKQRISNKKLRVAVDLPAGFERTVREGGAATVGVLHYEGEIKSGLGVREIESFLQKYRTALVVARLSARGLPAELVKPFEVKRQNVAPPEKVGGATIGGVIPYLIVILCFTGAMYPAMDLTAGEKERGTMETLLCSPTNRVNIVMGKFLVVLTASVATMIFFLLSMGGTALVMIAGKAQALSAASAQSVSVMPSIDPAGAVGVFAMVAPVAVFFAALLLTVSLFAKSYKEAQSYAGPLILVVIIPAMFGLLPGIELSYKTALIPILNLSLVCKEMLSGTWNWHFIALIFGSSCVYAGLGLAFCVKMFNREDVMFRA